MKQKTKKKNLFQGSQNLFQGSQNNVRQSMGSFGIDLNEQLQQQKVETQLSKEALRLMTETTNMGSNVLVSLQTQQEQLDRIEEGVDNIHNNLDKTKEYIKSIKSLPHYIGNSLKNRKKRITAEPIDRTRSKNLLNVEILCKMPDDSFSVGVLLFDENEFSCIDPDTDRLISEEMIYNYDLVDKIVMRARREHMDIRFNNDKPRFRLMSSYLQIITNEIVLRCKKDQVQVIFEPSVEKFEYGNPKIITKQTPSIRKNITSGFFHRVESRQTSSLLSDNVDDQTKQDLDETDKDLDQISNLLGDLNGISLTINKVVDNQTDQLDRINDRTDGALNRIQRQNKELDGIISS